MFSMKDSKSTSDSKIEDPLGPYDVSIVDTASGKFVEALAVAMQLSCPDSHIPEILSVFGRSSFLKFLNVFQGLTIKVPSRDVLDAGIRDVSVFLTLTTTSIAQRTHAVRSLAASHGVTPGVIRDGFARVSKAFETLGLRYAQ
jgi:hypothetical protein